MSPRARVSISTPTTTVVTRIRTTYPAYSLQKKRERRIDDEEAPKVAALCRPPTAGDYFSRKR
jgi:hypothetical protein